MLLKIPILLMCWFLIQPHLAAKFCVQKYVNGKWITKGDCGGRERMSALQKQLKIRAADEKRKNRNVNGKWVVFQRRKHGHVDFFRGWDDYTNGFGSRDGDFWLGLETLYQMTKGGNMEMKIKMITRGGIHWVAKYSNFSIGPGSDFYRLHVSGYSGNATVGDKLAYHNNQQFSTKDADHDGDSGNCASYYDSDFEDADHDDASVNCASYCEGGWWYGNCASYREATWWYDNCYENGSNLNGNFHKTGVEGIALNRDGSFINLRFSEMQFRERAGN